MTAALVAAGPHVPSVLDRFARPPCAELLGCEVDAVRPEEGWIRLGFFARPQFLNPAGFVQGGLLTAMLDDCMGAAILTHTDGRLYSATISLTTNFLNPARAGRILGEGRVLQLGKTTGFAEARLLAPDGKELARATGSVRLVEAAKAVG
jgi:uncharacterized protein (TIGR00369 family)